MIGHQAICLNAHIKLMLQYSEIVEIAPIILVVRKHNLSIMTSLNHMVWTVRQNDTPHPWHRVFLLETLVGTTLTHQ